MLKPAPRQIVPIAVTIAAIGLLSVMDAVMKRAATSSGVYPVLLCRSALAVLILGPVWRLRGGIWPARAALRLHLARGVTVAAMAASFFWGLVRLPMAEAIALSFISPLIALWLAAIQLGERIRPQAVLGALTGLAGVMVIALGRIRMGPAHGPEAAWGMGAILLSATFYAWNLVLQRRQALLAAPLEVALFQNLVVGLCLLPAFPLLWHQPPPAALGDIALAALLISASLMMLTWAYARAETQVLVSAEYTAFVWAILMGWLWFSETVAPATLGGLILILGGVWLGARRSSAKAIPPA